eukprot:5852902-Pleurochrysis_carterae.AAC.2
MTCSSSHQRHSRPLPHGRTLRRPYLLLSPRPRRSRSYGITPSLAPPASAHDHLPQFAECDMNTDAAQMHEQLDGRLAALQALGENPGTVKKDEAAWRVARWCENPITPDAILQEARLLCKGLPLVLATMRPRRKQDVAPRPASGYNVRRQVRRVHLRAGRDMVKAEHLRRALDGLQQQFVVLHGHEALLPRRKFPMSQARFHRLTASSAMPEAPLLCASLLATLCLLYVSGF